MKKDNENLYTFLYALKETIRFLSKVIMVLIPLAIGTGIAIDAKEKKQKKVAKEEQETNKNNNKNGKN
jgi:preprotein translocase subunit SecG